jgi:hypothetical protein
MHTPALVCFRCDGSNVWLMSRAADPPNGHRAEGAHTVALNKKNWISEVRPCCVKVLLRSEGVATPRILYMLGPSLACFARG